MGLTKGFIMRRSRFFSIVPALAAALLLTFAGAAEAQKAPRAKASVKNGVKTTKWKSNGVRMEHRTHGNSKIGFERRATGKDGTTRISGKLWGNIIRGIARPGFEKVTATSPSGETRTTTTKTAKNGTVRKTIDMPQQNNVRKITTWRSGSKQLQHTRDYDRKTGKLKSESRMSSKAQ
jgi:hypothetical protein